MSDDNRDYAAADLCFGCRATTQAPPTLSDQFPSGSPPPAHVWQHFTCARCGVRDVRLVVVGSEG